MRPHNSAKHFLITITAVAIFLQFGLLKIAETQILGPVSSSVLFNDTARLRCRINFNSDYNRIRVQWLKDGFGYENETLRDYFNGRYQMPGPKETGTYDLVIHSVDKQDDGEYACQVNAAIHNHPDSNILKTTKSINLTVIVPPDKVVLKCSQFEIQNISVNNDSTQIVWGKINEFVSIACEVQYARPAAELVWMLGNFELREGKTGDIEGLEIGSVMTKSEPVDKTDQFFYRSESNLRLRLRRDHSGEVLKCNVVNDKNFLYKTPKPGNIIINVLYVIDVKLEVIPHRSFFQFAEHEIIQINCSATTNPTSVIYNWIKYDPQSSKMIMLKSFDHHGILRLKMRRDLNSMLIRCQVLSSISGYDCINNMDPNTEISENFYLQNCSQKHIVSSSSQIPLRVRYSPIILDSVLETKSAFFGDVVTMECKADSNPPAKISWYKSKFSSKEIMANPELVTSGNIQKNYAASSYSSMTLLSVSDKYQFTVTEAEKLGLFICLAKADGFNPVQKTVFVGQGAAPKIINNQKIIIAKLGQPIRIPCHIISIPLPEKGKILWYKNSKAKPIVAKLKNQIYQEERLAGVVSYLYLHQVTYDDYGVYNCSVTNLYGHISSTIDLIPPAETPMIFIIGSSCSVALAFIFALIIFCIIRTSKIRSSSIDHRPAYIKGHMMTPCHSPLNQENFGTGFSNSYIDSVGDFGNVDFIQMTQKNNYVAPCSSGSQTLTNNISGIYLDSNLNYYQTDTKDLKSILEADKQQTQNIYQRRSDWIENQISQVECANESTRSYDSGVCPDESILTSCSPYHPSQSANFGLPSSQIIPFYQTSKLNMDLPNNSNQFYQPNYYSISNNLFSSIPLSTGMCSKPFMTDENRKDINYQLSSANDPIILPNLQFENRSVNHSLQTSGNLPDLTDTHDSMVPYIIAYSPTILNRKYPDWILLNQSTKL